MAKHWYATFDPLLSPDEARAAVRAAGIQPPGDVHASSEYRAHLAEVLAERAARRAVEGR